MKFPVSTFLALDQPFHRCKTQ